MGARNQNQNKGTTCEIVERSALELCRDRVDGNSNEKGASMMDNYCHDVHEVGVDNMIDGELEALLDLRDNEFEEEEWSMTTTTTNVMKTTMTTSTISFKGGAKWENTIYD